MLRGALQFAEGVAHGAFLDEGLAFGGVDAEAGFGGELAAEKPAVFAGGEAEFDLAAGELEEGSGLGGAVGEADLDTLADAVKGLGFVENLGVFFDEFGAAQLDAFGAGEGARGGGGCREGDLGNGGGLGQDAGNGSGGGGGGSDPPGGGGQGGGGGFGEEGGEAGVGFEGGELGEAGVFGGEALCAVEAEEGEGGDEEEGDGGGEEGGGGAAAVAGGVVLAGFGAAFGAGGILAADHDTAGLAEAVGFAVGRFGGGVSSRISHEEGEEWVD